MTSGAMLATVWALPFLGAVLAWAFGPQLRARAGALCTGLLGLSFVLTVALFHAASERTGEVLGVHQHLVSWLPGFDFGLALDPLSLVWTLIITGVGFLIHLYSNGYLAGDRAIARFFAYLNFFVFAMLTLVLSDNFVGLLVGWGLVGVASYFLIGYDIHRPAAVAAARKAFVINVVGDVGLMFAIVLLFAQLGVTDYAGVFAKAGSLGPQVVLWACIGIFVACAAKSAQVPLHTWLPDAMEGPTPVSALIHAATMVTAGVYLVARCSPLWHASPEAQEMVGVVGAVTALSGAILGTVQWDIKRILAYSTMSQIGYMIMGVGVGVYEAGVLHFFTHAFFKALLFLAAGLVIHELAGEQDVRKMGGLRARMPLAFWAITAGVLAICGIPLFSGFYSKDAVVYGALVTGHPWLYAVGALTAGITAYYMFRMWFLTFFGNDRTAHDAAAHGPDAAGHEHAHDNAWTMAFAVGALILPAVAAGYLAIGGENSPWSRWLGPVFETTRPTPVAAPFSELASTGIVLGLVALGILVAYLRYGTAGATANDAERLAGEAERTPGVLRRAYYVDDLIGVLIVRPAQLLGAVIARVVDPRIVDGLVRDFVWLAGLLGLEVRTLQNGQLRTYAFTMTLGIVAFLVYFAYMGYIGMLGLGGVAR